MLNEQFLNVAASYIGTFIALNYDFSCVKLLSSLNQCVAVMPFNDRDFISCESSFYFSYCPDDKKKKCQVCESVGLGCVRSA